MIKSYKATVFRQIGMKSTSLILRINILQNLNFPQRVTRINNQYAFVFKHLLTTPATPNPNPSYTPIAKKSQPYKSHKNTASSPLPLLPIQLIRLDYLSGRISTNIKTRFKRQ